MSSENVRFLEQLEVRRPRELDNLLVFGLRRSSASGGQYLTLDEALGTGKCEVSELGEEGQVPTLAVKNQLAERVLLVAGEELIGAKQNRIINASIMIPPQADVNIPVSCAEESRWHRRSRTFGSSSSSAHAALRSAMTRATSEGYRRTGRASSDQRSVWSEIRRKLAAMGSSSHTDALHQAYDDQQHRLDEVLRSMTVPTDCSGAVFAIGGRIVGADIFDSPATLAKLWPKILRGYAIDALEAHDVKGAALRRKHGVRWLRSALELREEPYESVGLGWDVRLSSPTTLGAALVVDGSPVHLTLFTR